MDRAYKSYYVRIMAKPNTYQGKTSIRYTALKCYGKKGGYRKQNNILLYNLKAAVGESN